MRLKFKNLVIFFVSVFFVSSFFRSENVIGSTEYIDNIYSVKSTKNIKYGQAVGYNGQTENLLFDVYEPNDIGTDKRPLIIFVHGGSFVSGDKSVYSENATELAKKGYVVSSINYRLDTTHGGPYNARSPDLDKPIDTSREDTLIALRFLIGKSQDYKIDTNKIFLGGSSAGAVTALYTGFSEEVDAKKIKAVYGIAGTVIEDDLDIIDENDPSTIMFNGTTDDIVPYEMAKATIDKLKSKGVTAELVSYQGMGHSIISQKNTDIHQKLVQFLLPYATANTPSITVTIIPSTNPSPTQTPTPTTTPLTVDELLKNYLFGDKKADLNGDGIVNGFDYFQLYEKANN